LLNHCPSTRQKLMVSKIHGVCKAQILLLQHQAKCKRLLKTVWVIKYGGRNALRKVEVVARCHIVVAGLQSPGTMPVQGNLLSEPVAAPGLAPEQSLGGSRETQLHTPLSSDGRLQAARAGGERHGAPVQLCCNRFFQNAESFKSWALGCCISPPTESAFFERVSLFFLHLPREDIAKRKSSQTYPLQQH
jgi:hypothetical protein